MNTIRHPMFISVLELFTVGIGPSSSHTVGPLVAAQDFRRVIEENLSPSPETTDLRIRCTLKGSLAYTGKGHATDRAVALGLFGYTPQELAGQDVDQVFLDLLEQPHLPCAGLLLSFSFDDDIIFDRGEALPEHPNGMIFEILDNTGQPILSRIYFSIGGGFINKRSEIQDLVAPLRMEPSDDFPFPFPSAMSMLEMSRKSGLSIAEMKRVNEHEYLTEEALDKGLDSIWTAMHHCISKGLSTSGPLAGGILTRRAKVLYDQLVDHPEAANVTDWLCAYAMAVSEENAAGNMVVTAPTNGAAGVIPAVLYYFVNHQNGTLKQVHDFLLTAAAIGGIIKMNSSISGAEVGCQGEVGSAASMAAAGLCAARGGTPEQIENAAEMALEHHLGMTCDPVGGLVQVPCIERNGFGAIKAYTAASLAMKGTGEHFMSLDRCVAAMKQTGLEMSVKYKETSLGGLAVSITEC